MRSDLAREACCLWEAGGQYAAGGLDSPLPLPLALCICPQADFTAARPVPGPLQLGRPSASPHGQRRGPWRGVLLLLSRLWGLFFRLPTGCLLRLFWPHSISERCRDPS